MKDEDKTKAQLLAELATQRKKVADLDDRLSEHATLQAQLFEAQKLEALGTLARGIAHDFNNILSVIMGFTELVLDELPRRTSAHDNLTEVLKASRRAKMLVQHILTFSRSAREQYASISLHPIIEDTLSFVSATLPAVITLRTQLDHEAGLVAADPSRIQQLLMNLCINAVQAMRVHGGALDVTLQRVEIAGSALSRPVGLMSGSYLKLTVRDAGSGMTPEVQARIFEPFFTTKPVGEGSGLGLAIVHGIVTSYGGAITVESALGQGAAFHVYLPATDNTAPAG
jgi:signal transduction histidine kinase